MMNSIALTDKTGPLPPAKIGVNDSIATVYSPRAKHGTITRAIPGAGERKRHP